MDESIFHLKNALRSVNPLLRYVNLDFNRLLFSNYRPPMAPIKNKRSAHTERKNNRRIANMAIPCHLFSIKW